MTLQIHMSGTGATPEAVVTLTVIANVYVWRASDTSWSADTPEFANKIDPLDNKAVDIGGTGFVNPDAAGPIHTADPHMAEIAASRDGRNGPDGTTTDNGDPNVTIPAVADCA